ncbi:hypothetical protein [Corallococcus sp. EGB]|uniref:hypothetical protein n=1 Tax=Corallococcus sp. EGB TaxID=1521117 RepID=UPI001CBB0EEF|nr:hypothetical protein [Corallococcus sp. EGB]
MRSELTTAMRDADDVVEAALEQAGVLEDLLTRAASRPVQAPASSSPERAAHGAKPAPIAPMVEPQKPRRHLLGRWVLSSGLAVAAVAGISLWANPPPAPQPIDVEPVVDVPATPSNVVWADVLTGSSTSSPMAIERIVVPKKPLPGQAVPPCPSPARDLNGACWVKVDSDPPCPKNTAEYRGGCYIPVPENPDKKVPLSSSARPFPQ